MATSPNVLLICVDHLPWGLTRPAGHPTCMTPTLSQLARSGVSYTNAYSACPVCIPARRNLMTGQSMRTHGMRTFDEHAEMPDAPTLARCFREAGYQAHAVGKLHVYPQRDRIGFDEVVLNEEGRHHVGAGADDWELFLAERGYAGQEYASGLCNNDYHTRSWHLPDDCHPTNWAAREMCRMMHRRDPRHPAFWYLSFVGPHQPVWPLQAYNDLYRDAAIEEPIHGPWSAKVSEMPYALRRLREKFAIADATPFEIESAIRAFYASITHIDHQIRIVLGYLREQGLIDNTIIAFTSDHGEMLGDHGLWAKSVFYQNSANIPFIVVPASGDDRLPMNTQDHRLVELQDMMPTLLDLAGIDIPDTVDGKSLLNPGARETLYGEFGEGETASRMVRSGPYKLIYYPLGNCFQLFNVEEDPREIRNLSDDPGHEECCYRLAEILMKNLYGQDLEWIRNGKLVGLPEPKFTPSDQRKLTGQRGIRFL